MLSGTLVAFVTTAVNVPSAVQSYTVSGSNLVSAVDISAPSGFEVSLMASGGFAPNLLSPAPVSGVLASTMVFVRYNTSTGMSHGGDISHAGLHATTKFMAAGGTVVPPPAIIVAGSVSAFTTTIGTPSAEQNYTVSGANLVFAIGVSAPAGFEVSLTPGGGFAAAINTPAPVAGTIPPTTVYVRYNPATGTTHGGSITHTSTGASSQAIAVSGTATAPLQPGGSGSSGSGGCAAGSGGSMALALLALAAMRRRQLPPVARQVA
jgi:Synergist-CTERM protein sorting domain-containing protein